VKLRRAYGTVFSEKTRENEAGEDAWGELQSVMSSCRLRALQIDTAQRLVSGAGRQLARLEKEELSGFGTPVSISEGAGARRLVSDFLVSLPVEVVDADLLCECAALLSLKVVELSRLRLFKPADRLREIMHMVEQAENLVREF